MGDKDLGRFLFSSVLGNVRRLLTDDRDFESDTMPVVRDRFVHGSGDRTSKNVLKDVAIFGASTLALAGSRELYHKIFSRYERPDYALKPGVYCYGRISDRLKRRDVSFYSGGTRLAGYYYPVENAKGLVVFAHGFHAGADDYLPVFEYMTQNGFAVFAFDTKGTYDSEGDSTVGLPEALVDLDAALNYIKSCAQYRKYPLFLLGHSCGGYAVTAVLNLHRDIRACASIAPMNRAASMIIEKGELYTSMLPTSLLTELPEAFLKPYQEYLFGKYADMTAVDGINSTDIPVLIAHGNRDMVVDFNRSLSVIGLRDRIRAENVYYYVGSGEQSGHDSIWHSAEAKRYQKIISQQFKEMNREEEMTYTEKVRFYAQVDHECYSAINEKLFAQIVQMFNAAL